MGTRGGDDDRNQERCITMRHRSGRTLAVVVIAATVIAARLARSPSGLALAEPGLQSGDADGTRVRPGIDVLLTDSITLITGKRVGLITNQTGIDANGVPTIDRIAALSRTPNPEPRTRLIALFAPEHGIRGTLRPGESVRDTTLRVAEDTVDAATGLPIYSLFGPRRAPTAAQLESVDVLLVDLQDVGARTFTYISTVVYAMRAVAALHKRIVVLDRPNPIGCTMQGPVLDTAYASFIGLLPVPLRHGLTLGELARFANGELHIGADLVVVPVTGWRRCDWFDRTGLPWVRPSPNLPDLQSVAWYPGTVLLEATNLSVGRGTDAPFRQLGAPWYDPRGALQMLRFAHRPGHDVRFRPAGPGDGKYDGATVRGLRLPALRRDDDPVAMAVWLLDAVAAQQRDSFRLDTLGFFRRLGIRFMPGRTGVCSATDCGDFSSFRWDDQINVFRHRVDPYLLYGEDPAHRLRH
jgi:uncharacterized protein YbbC (DUF1343 family)